MDTRRRYVTLRPLGIVEGRMKNMVLLSLMRFPTPCVNRPKSFANDFTHFSLSGPRERAAYSREIPVSWSMTTLAIASV